jgi:F0F1-type ATP synthase membrane subunit a
MKALPFMFLLIAVGLALCTAAHSEARQDFTTAAISATEFSSMDTVRQSEGHGLSAKAVEIGRAYKFPITNSMVVSWMVALGLIFFSQLATRKMEVVPKGAQNFLEWLVEGLYNFMMGILGPQLAKRTFWFFATVFIFILSANRVGLIPGVSTMGWGHQTVEGFRITQPLFRGANADVNMTLAMSLVFFLCWLVWAFREVGVRGFFTELFAPKGESEGVLVSRGCLDPFSANFSQLSSLRKHFRRRKPVRSDGQACSRLRMVDTCSVLLLRTANGIGSGTGFYVANGSVHHADVPAPHRTGSHCTRVMVS